MSNRIRHWMTLGTVLGFSWAGSLTAAEATHARAARLEVRVYNRAGVAAKTLYRAQRDVGRVFKQAGVELLWVDCAAPEARQARNSSCGLEPTSAWIRLTVMPKSMVSAAEPLSNDVFGITLPTGILVFPDQTGELAGWYGFSESQTLGLVIAHELGHGLLADGHTTAGLMRAHLNQHDVLAFGEGRLWFTEDQASLMRSLLRSQTGKIGQLSMPRDPSRDEIPPGTLSMLILKTLARGGEMHGSEIATAIERISENVLQVEEGSLYPALQRMLMKGWVAAECAVTAGNRRARYYKLTKAGRKQLEAELSQFQRVNQAILRVIQMA